MLFREMVAVVSALAFSVTIPADVATAQPKPACDTTMLSGTDQDSKLFFADVMMIQARHQAIVKDKATQLIRAKVWNDADAQQFFDGIASWPAVLAVQAEKTEAIAKSREMIAASRKRVASEGTPSEGTCKMIEDLRSSLQKVTALFERQWQLINARIDAVAKAKGVKFQPLP